MAKFAKFLIVVCFLVIGITCRVELLHGNILLIPQYAYSSEIKEITTFELKKHFKDKTGIDWVDGTTEEKEKFIRYYRKVKRAEQRRERLKVRSENKKKRQHEEELRNKKRLLQEKERLRQEQKREEAKKKSKKRSAEKKKMRKMKKKFRKLRKDR